MASLKDTVTLITQLTELTEALHDELSEGNVDFEKMIELADEISEQADSLASAFTRVNAALTEPLEQSGNDGGDGASEEEGGRSSSSDRSRSAASSASNE